MATQKMDNQSLIFIPDISGFTKFVNNTEINHAKHIIEELLEVIIDANEIGLELSEIEGDALLFYRRGKAPTAAELLAQVQRMYVKFHGHLKRYETARICSCGACCQTNDLRLKFIAHFGDVAEKQVKDRSKLFGKDVIVAHRLLKNQVKSDEYSLFSDNLVRACATWMSLPEVAWSDVTQGEEELDTGTTKYCFVELEPLSSYVPEPKVEDYSISGATKKLMENEHVIEAPIDLAFDVLSDLSYRHEFTTGLVGSDSLSDSLTRTGSTHRCVFGEDQKNPFFVSHNFTFEQSKVTFVESNHKDGLVMVWSLTAIGKGLTRMNLSIFVKPNFIKELLFKLMLKKKYMANNQQTLSKFNEKCKELVAEGKQHRSQIVLPEEVLKVA